MQFLKFLSLLQKRGLSSAIFGISFPSQKMWTIICNLWNFIPKSWIMIRNLWNFIPFSKNVDYHKQFLKFLSFLQKRGLLYAIFVISFPSQKTWANFCNFFPFSKNMVYHLQFLEFISLLKKCGLLYAIYGI